MKKTQIGWVMNVVVIIINVIVLFGYNSPGGNHILVLISLALLLLFNSLTITVEEGFVKFSFGIGIIKGQYRIDDIISCKSINYFPLGWGIRWRPGVILFNVSGTKAIELTIKGKSRKIWIGTDKPDLLADYINTLLNNRA